LIEFGIVVVRQRSGLLIQFYDSIHEIIQISGPIIHQVFDPGAVQRRAKSGAFGCGQTNDGDTKNIRTDLAPDRAFTPATRQPDFRRLYPKRTEAVQTVGEPESGSLHRGSRHVRRQRELSISYQKVSEVLLEQGKFPEGLEAAQQSLAITKWLAEQNKIDTDWQRDLAVSYDWVGIALLDQKKFSEAMDAFQHGLTISNRLTQQDKTNTRWQRTLAVCQEWIGNVLQDQGKVEEALNSYEQSLAIHKHLVEQDETNKAAQYELSVAYNKVGELLEKQGTLEGAFDAFGQALAILKRLTEQDKTNTDWQELIAWVEGRIGQVLEGQGKLPETLEAYRHFLATADLLASRDPSNVTWQVDEVNARWCVAKILIRTKDGDRDEARRLVTEGMEISERLKHERALNLAGQDTLNKLNDIANSLDLPQR